MGLGLALIAATVIGQLLEPDSSVAVLRPSAGVGIVWALLARSRAELVLSGGLVLAMATWSSLMGGAGLTAALAAGAARLLVTHGGRVVLKWMAHNTRSFQAGDFARLLTVADASRHFLGIIPMVLLGQGVLYAAGLWDSAPTAVQGMLTWGLGQYVSTLVVALPILALRSAKQVLTWPRPAEILGVTSVNLALLLLIFGGNQGLPVAYVALLPVIWAGIRMPLPIATLQGSVLAIGSAMLVVTTNGGPFASLTDPFIRTLAAQGFMALAVILAVAVSASMGERDRWLVAIEQSENQARARAGDMETLLGQLRKSREHVQRLFRDAPHGVVQLRPDGVIVDANQSMATIVGREVDDLQGSYLHELSPRFAQEMDAHLAEVATAAGAAVSTVWTVPGSNGHADELQISMTSRMIHDSDHGDHVLMHVVDDTARLRDEKHLSYLADHDILTGLHNRHFFDNHLVNHLEVCDRYGPRGGLIQIDLDHFKEVNDTLGHSAGDELLVRVAHALRGSLRGTDVVARLGGDEFAVLLPEADEASLAVVAAKIVRTIGEVTQTLEGVARRVTASVGATTFAAAAVSEHDPLALADMLMYDAKAAGRNRFAIAQPVAGKQPELASRLAWKSRLENALEADQFELFLQPILDLRSNEVHGAEALLRLVDRGRPVPPGEFIAIAENTGLAPALDAWVMRRGAAIAAQMRRIDPDFVLEVNISGHSIGDPTLESALTQSLSTHAVDPGALVLEITETAAVADVEAARGFAERLTAHGVRFALDDFGAGFGSFYYVKHLVFDFLKIDGEFVANAAASPIDRTILGTIADLARNLGKKTVAEFVADEATLAVVREQDIDFAQGFLIGRPVPVDEFVDTHLRPLLEIA